ncbi:unnamed protein product [Symbiodinium necroappetens]|uniref:Uncharacterized protein n=1 Tax=Symbiodinium necroappetens TaxID=1628268 RepID=A0A812L0J6_9DINO|nr:unnamed protein product [Symbiodinium necroappetens]
MEEAMQMITTASGVVYDGLQSALSFMTEGCSLCQVPAWEEAEEVLPFCQYRTACRVHAEPKELVAHLVGLVQPERMDVYTFALGQLCHPDDREQRLLCSDFHTREGYRGLECLFSKKLSHWWSMNPAAYVDVLSSLRKHRSANPDLRVVISDLASKLLCHGPDRRARHFLIRDVLEMLRSADFNDQFRAIRALRNSTAHLGRFRSKCKAALAPILAQKPKGKVLRACATSAVERLDELSSRQQKLH